MLSSDQIADFREQGFLLLENMFSKPEVTALLAETQKVLDDARNVTRNNSVYDLEDSHSPDDPRVRRIKNPQKVSTLFKEIIRDPRTLEMVAQLIGPDIRLCGSKVNTKSAGFGAAVEWHQDWAFFPSTNDDRLTVSVMLDPMTEKNGPLMFLPGSHRGPTLNHHYDGRFCGAIDPKTSDTDFTSAKRMLGSAGTLIFHHVRIVHGSDINRSDMSRRLLLTNLAAADSWPLVGSYSAFKTLDEFDEHMIAGNPTVHPRFTNPPVYIPLPGPNDPSSVYTVQNDLKNRYFNQIQPVKALAT